MLSSASSSTSSSSFLIYRYADTIYVNVTDGVQVVAQELMDIYENLFMLYEVDMMFWGHYHNYQRSCLVAAGSCVGYPDSNNIYYADHGQYIAPLHVVIGSAGHRLSHNQASQQPEWLIYLDQTNYGYLRSHVDDDSIKFEFVVGDDSKVQDTFYLYRSQL